MRGSVRDTGRSRMPKTVLVYTPRGIYLIIFLMLLFLGGVKLFTSCARQLSIFDFFLESLLSFFLKFCHLKSYKLTQVTNFVTYGFVSETHEHY